MNQLPQVAGRWGRGFAQVPRTEPQVEAKFQKEEQEELRELSSQPPSLSALIILTVPQAGNA